MKINNNNNNHMNQKNNSNTNNQYLSSMNINPFSYNGNQYLCEQIPLINSTNLSLMNHQQPNINNQNQLPFNQQHQLLYKQHNLNHLNNNENHNPLSFHKNYLHSIDSTISKESEIYNEQQQQRNNKSNQQSIKQKTTKPSKSTTNMINIASKISGDKVSIRKQNKFYQDYQYGFTKPTKSIKLIRTKKVRPVLHTINHDPSQYYLKYNCICGNNIIKQQLEQEVEKEYWGSITKIHCDCCHQEISYGSIIYTCVAQYGKEVEEWHGIWNNNRSAGYELCEQCIRIHVGDVHNFFDQIINEEMINREKVFNGVTKYQI